MTPPRVLFIDPPGIDGQPIGRVLGSFGTNKADQAWPPYDLQILAGCLAQDGCAWRILDANNLDSTPEEIRQVLCSFRPDWVILLTCFQSFVLDMRVARLAKEALPGVRTAAVSLSIRSLADPEDLLRRHPELDFLPWGDPEPALREVIFGRGPQDIPGLWYREQGEPRFSGGISSVTTLDDLGVPRHEGLPFQIYRCPLAIRRPMTVVNCSRGCVNRCIHCQAGSFQHPLRYRSVENVLAELREVKRLGIREIKFYDCSLPSHRPFMESLGEGMVAERFGFSWNCNSRADRLDPTILRRMKRAGCHTISIGCESASPEILANMGKNETVEQIERGVRLVQEVGMRVLMYLTFGLEGETRETMRRTYSFVERMQPDFVTFGIVVPAPGTPYYELLDGRGWLENRAFHKQDPTALPSFRLPDLPPGEILEFTRVAYRRYYFRPQYVWRRLCRLRSLHELLTTASNAWLVARRYLIPAR